MKNSIITDKLKQYPIAVICVVLLVAFGAVIFLRGGVTADLSVLESDLNSRIRTIEENKKNSNNLGQDTEDLSIIVEKVNSLLFDRYERAINISFFYEFEDKADVVISDITQLPEPDPIYSDGGARTLSLHSTLVFNINLSGSFADILKFLHEVDRVEPIIRVADFQIARKGNDLGGASVDARLRLLVMAKKD